MKVLINDYAGHAFPLDLSVSLASRGHSVTHNYCASNLTPQGDHAGAAELGVSVKPIDLGRQFSKYQLHRRVIDEFDYGVRSLFDLVRVRPDAVLLGQLPVFSLLVCLLFCRIRRIHAVLWLQDLQAHLAADRSRTAARLLGLFERLAVRLPNAVVTISEEMADEARSYGGRAEITVIENWARLAPLVDKANPWAKQVGADGTFNFVYSGTLGTKHRPEALVALAEAFADKPEVRVLAVCAGAGRDEIESTVQPTSPEFFDLVEPEVLPDVLAAADVLVVLLDEAVASAVVPSKILSYLVAGRPILGLVPEANLAARIIRDHAGAGLVSGTIDDFVNDAKLLLADPGERRMMAAQGRAWAEATFDLEAITDRFEHLLLQPGAASESTARRGRRQPLTAIGR